MSTVQITETDLRALFLPYGPIYTITIPVEKPSSSVETPQEPSAETNSKPRKPRARGFAFVWFFSKKDAERGIAGVNGRAVRAGAVGAPTMNKKERARLRRKLRAEGGAQEGGAEEDEAEVDVSERIVAVDWALSKEKWEEAKVKGLVQTEGGKNENEDGSGLSEEGSASEQDSSDGDSSSYGNGDEEDKSENGEDEDDAMDVDVEEMEDEERSDAEELRKPALPQTDVGTTLFIRNLPFDATEDELRLL